MERRPPKARKLGSAGMLFPFFPAGEVCIWVRGSPCAARSSEQLVLFQNPPPCIPSLPHRPEWTPLSNEHTQENKTCFSNVGGKEERKGERKEAGGRREGKQCLHTTRPGLGP